MLHSLKMLSYPWLSHLQNNPQSARDHKPFLGTAATLHVALNLPRVIGHKQHSVNICGMTDQNG